MQGQILFRSTGQKNKSGKNVFIALGVVSIECDDEIKDGFKYDILDIAFNNGQDFSEMSNGLSPEDLLEEEIWKVK